MSALLTIITAYIGITLVIEMLMLNKKDISTRLSICLYYIFKKRADINIRPNRRKLNTK